MDMILKMLDHQVDTTFLHADEAIASTFVAIQWLSQGKYDKIITFLGGFKVLLSEI